MRTLYPVAKKKGELPAMLQVESDVFKDNGFFPYQYAGTVNRINPPLHIRNIPDQTKSLAVILEDHDGDLHGRTHWVMWNIPPDQDISAGHVPGVAGLNSYMHHCYNGPIPQEANHQFVFRVYALDTLLHMQRVSGREHMLKAMKNHVIGFGKISCRLHGPTGLTAHEP